MNIYIRNIFLGLTFIVSGAANAVLINGSVEITGAFVPVDAGFSPVGLDAATGIDFTNGFVVASAGDLSNTGHWDFSQYVGLPVQSVRPQPDHAVACC